MYTSLVGVWGRQPPPWYAGFVFGHIWIFQIFQIFPKYLTQQLRISKKVRLASWQFQKKIGSFAEDYKKTSGPLLRIPEKQRVSC